MIKFFCFMLVCSSLSLAEYCSHGEDKYSAEAGRTELTKEEMFERGHMKPFGAHRPPMNVEKLKYMISPEDFYTHYVVHHKPVLIKNVTQKWPAYHLWTDEYLLEKYGDTVLHMENKEDDKANLPPDRTLKQFLLDYKKENLYLVDEVLPAMRDEIKLPLCLQCEEIDTLFFVAFYWHSNGGTSSTVHLDTDENLMCVIKGHKKAVLVSSIYSHDLYADDSKQMGVLDVNSSAVDLEKYPNIMNIRHYETVVEEGDCLYIPQMWWHQVNSRESERQQSVAMWWKSIPSRKKTDDQDQYVVASSLVPVEKRRNHSYADSLLDYEFWVQNYSLNARAVQCKEQDVRMSAYSWETDKEAAASYYEIFISYISAAVNYYYFLLTGANFEMEWFHGRSTVKKIIKKPTNRFTCLFDSKNKKNPCYHLEDDDSSDTFLRYVMDYCQVFEDFGCIITRPMYLTKLWNDQFHNMAFLIPSTFLP